MTLKEGTVTNGHKGTGEEDVHLRTANPRTTTHGDVITSSLEISRRISSKWYKMQDCACGVWENQAMENMTRHVLGVTGGKLTTNG